MAVGRCKAWEKRGAVQPTGILLRSLTTFTQSLFYGNFL